MYRPRAPRALRQLPDRLGRRGICLLLVGAMWVAVGIGIELDRPTRAAGELILHELIPTPIRVALWVGSGLVAVWYGARGTRLDDTPGFVALMVMPIERCLSYLVSWLMWPATGALGERVTHVEQIGYDRGWYAALVWLIVVVLVQLISGWRNPPTLPTPPLEREG